MEPLISVVVPAFNLESYIAETLDSILAQSYRHLEIIVVDDGSTDQTAAVADRYALADRRIRVFHQDNAGVGRARFRGVSEAKGEWIGFVDGDDMLDPNMFERLLANALRSGAEISHCGYKMLYSDHTAYYYDTRIYTVEKSEDALKTLMSGRYEPSLCNKLFRRELFRDLPDSCRGEAGIRINEDLLTNFYLFRSSKKLVFEDLCLYSYRIRRDSSSHVFRDYKLRDPAVVRKILLEETKDEEKLHSLCLSSLTQHLVRVGTIRTSTIKDSETAACIVELREELRKLLGQIRRDRFLSTKLKLQAYGVVYMPALYRFVHRIYEKRRKG